VTSDSCFAAAALSALAVVVNGEAVLLSPWQGDAYGQRWVDRELLRSGVGKGRAQDAVATGQWRRIFQAVTPLKPSTVTPRQTPAALAAHLRPRFFP
jgi:hypothetical protein